MNRTVECGGTGKYQSLLSNRRKTAMELWLLLLLLLMISVVWLKTWD
jgi:hypothetical protein